MQSGSPAEARQAERAVLFVECPSSAGVLCRAIVRAVAPHVPGAIIRLDPKPAGLDALRITFHPATQAGDFAGHLSWRAPGGAVGQGPVHRATHGNVATSSVAAQRFAEGLVKITPQLQSILAATKLK